MNELLVACSARLPHPVWEHLHRLDFEGDVGLLRDWLERLLVRQPPPEHINGLYFGLAEYSDEGRDGTICRLGLVGGTSFDPVDEACVWAVEPAYTPDGGTAESAVLSTIYRQVQAAGEAVATLGEYVLGLGYACLAVRTLCESLPQLILGPAVWRGVAVGFDCGDAVILGTPPRGRLASLIRPFARKCPVD
jgi:hypothetical protein